MTTQIIENKVIGETYRQKNKQTPVEKKKYKKSILSWKTKTINPKTKYTLQAKNEEFSTLVKKRPVINYFHPRYFLITTYTFRLMT